MTYKMNNAAYALNSYIWKLLEANLEWKKNDYNGLVPIIPLAQQPELMQTGRPFLVYGATDHPSTHLYSLKSMGIAYTIYATTVSEANTIASLLVDTFERQDIAADDVNSWLNTEAAGRGTSRGISFGTIKTAMAQKAEPADEEGGLVASFVLLEARYTAPNNTLTTKDFLYTP
jgi:hypothetical protein